MTCPLCNRDLAPALQLLGPTALKIHRSVHMDEALSALLEKADEWPELEPYFAVVRRARDLFQEATK